MAKDSPELCWTLTKVAGEIEMNFWLSLKILSYV